MTTLIQSKVRPSRLGLGTGMLGTFGSSAGAKEVRGLLDSMIDNNISVIDTADTYGSGKAERLIGSGIRGRRERFFLMTKAGYRHGNLPWPFRAANALVKKALHKLNDRQRFDTGYMEACLKRSHVRLQTKQVDVFFLHDPTLADIEKLDFLRSIEHFQQNGWTAALGVSSGDPDVIKATLAGGVAKFIQCPANLADAVNLVDLWQECQRLGVTVVANHVMGPGSFGLPELTHEMRVRAAAALLPESAILLCGTRNPSHLAQTSGWADHPLGKEEAHDLLQRVKSTLHSQAT